MMDIDEERMQLLEDLKAYIENIIKEAQDRQRKPYEDPVRRGSLHGYIEAMTEILEYIEDNE